MKKLPLLVLFFLPLCMLAQEKGIHFEHGISWADVQAKAKTENKYIFIDCYTTWCGPCKYMTANIFPLEKVGTIMNEKFINVKIQLDTTDNDNEEVKSWFKDAQDIASKYQIRAYPTYLYFDSNGNIVHRSVGAGPAEDFLSKVKNALNPETQYYTLLNKYNAGQKDSAFLHSMAVTAMNAYDMENGKKIANEYLETQTDFYTKENLYFIQNFTWASSDKGFGILLKDPEKANAVLGKGAAESKVQEIIMTEGIFSLLPHDRTQKPDWVSISAGVTKKYPAQAPEAILKAKVIFYQRTKDWNNYQTTIVDYMKKYGDALNPQDLNNYAWTVFENCNDMKCMAEALEWSKRSFNDIKEPGFIDTYANILYKLGRKDEAIEWEQKAMDLAQGDDKKGYQEVIDKMKRGEQTWN